MYCEIILNTKYKLSADEYRELLRGDFPDLIPVDQAIDHTIFSRSPDHVKQDVMRTYIFAGETVDRVCLFSHPRASSQFSVHIETKQHPQDLYLLRKVAEDVGLELEALLRGFSQTVNNRKVKNRVREISMLFTAEEFHFLAADRAGVRYWFWKYCSEDLLSKGLIPAFAYAVTAIVTKNLLLAAASPGATVLAFLLWAWYKSTKQPHFYYHDINKP
jgi:hypothetical protein